MSKKVLKRKNVTITLEPDGFSIHTFELSRKFTRFEWVRIKDILYTEQEVYNRKHKKAAGWIYPDKDKTDDHICWRYSNFGIRIRLEHRTPKDSVECFYVRMIVNPRKLIDPQSSYLGILPPTEKSVQKLNQTFRSLFQNTPFEDDIQQYYLTRLDLCTNIRCMDQKMFRELIRLLRKTATPKKYERKLYCHADKKKANRYNKHYIRIACGSQELVIYDKCYQLVENDLAIAYENLPHGVMRVEVHYERAKLKKLENQLESDNPLAIIGQLMQKSKVRMIKLVEKCYPDLPYVSYEEANIMIELAACKTATKTRMHTLLEQMQRKQSLDAAFRWMDKHGMKTQDLLLRFAKLGINPIPLRKGFAASRVPSLVEILHKVENQPIMIELAYWKWK